MESGCFTEFRSLSRAGATASRASQGVQHGPDKAGSGSVMDSDGSNLICRRRLQKQKARTQTREGRRHDAQERVPPRTSTRAPGQAATSATYYVNSGREPFLWVPLSGKRWRLVAVNGAASRGSRENGRVPWRRRDTPNPSLLLTAGAHHSLWRQESVDVYRCEHTHLLQRAKLSIQ